MAIAFGLIGVPAKRNGLSMQFCLGKRSQAHDVEHNQRY
ncbi:hypothetical protein VCHENC02_2598 [Vibrio harveyi]|uniref:Uncharacterized protein n=1 Tax=Vibrio harveyi TaxID=669 RepID=A0A454CZH8_VIBHA|nr:hypothetical protein VCHENC02_2598 [Vibrio harveyi]